MKNITRLVVAVLSSLFIMVNVQAAKENFDRSKPHMAEWKEIEKVCKTDKKKCKELKKA